MQAPNDRSTWLARVERTRMGSLLMVVPFAALVAVTPNGGAGAPPSPVAGDSPLKEIGRVRATTPFCKAALVHALDGILVVVNNDARLTAARLQLRGLDRETSSFVVYKAQQQLLDDYVAVRDAAYGGRQAVGQLKREAKDAPSEAQKTALVSLANSLDSALTAQKALAERVAGSVMRADTYQTFADNAQPRTAFNVTRPEGDARRGIPAPRLLDASSDKLFPNAKRDADEIEQVAPRLAGDEADAATRIDDAFGAC